MSRMGFPYPGRGSRMSGGSMGSGLKVRLIIALVIAGFAVLSYYGRPGDENQITGESQRVAMTEEADEIRMGLAAKGEMAAQFGGADPDPRKQALVKQVGEELLKALDESLEPGGRSNPYRENFSFTLLADPKTVNAFALPGGQIFITDALLSALETKGQLAGVLAHEIGHVIERHSNVQMAKLQFFQGLAAAGGVAGGDVQSARMAQAVAQLASMKYGRDDELQSDQWGVRLTSMAGYDPRSMIGVMKVLAKASGGGGGPEFMSTHPSPANREQHIEAMIAKEFPNGVPPGLIK
jgi:beta-barrel assembly-enhancing protease